MRSRTAASRRCAGAAWPRPVETGEFSIDVVHMNGAGPRHTHHEGEINWCIALSGQPRFDGHGAGWVAFPGSTHVPTVEDGEMLIVYLLPNGAVEFHA